MSETNCDPRALKVARAVHERERPQATILFGSRARGDYEEGRSDIDIIQVNPGVPEQSYKDRAVEWAEGIAQAAYGRRVPVQLVWFSHADFHEHTRYVNHITTRALLDGVLLRGRAALPAVLHTRHLGRLALLLSIKARVEARDEATIRSSSSLGAGTRIQVTPALLGSYESEVIAGLPDEIACRIPGDDTGVELRWRRGALVTVRVEAPATAPAPLFTSVLGYGWVGGRQALLLSRAVPPAVQRLRRPPRPCVLTRVISRLSVDAGEQRQRAVLLDEQQCRGTLVSMVAGRAAIRSTAPLRAGSLVKLDIEPGSSPRLPLYGKVVRSPRRPAAGGVMQVQLTWHSQRHLGELYGFFEQFHAALPAAHA